MARIPSTIAFLHRGRCFFWLSALRARRFRGRANRKATDGRRPQGCDRHCRAGASTARAGPYRRNDHIAHGQGRLLGQRKRPHRRDRRTRSCCCKCRPFNRAFRLNRPIEIRRRSISTAFRSCGLQERSSQAQLDQARTSLDVAERTLQALLYGPAGHRRASIARCRPCAGRRGACSRCRFPKAPWSCPERRSPSSRSTIIFCDYSFPSGMPNS